MRIKKMRISASRMPALTRAGCGLDRAATTSQLPIEHWHGWIDDATIADAFLDRLMQHHH